MHRQHFRTWSTTYIVVHYSGVVSLTTAEDPERGSIVLLDPGIPCLEQQANGRGGGIEVSQFQTLHHLPVAT